MYKVKKKRVTIIISSYFAVCGGAERQFDIIANNLDKLGYDVTIITRNKDGKKDELFNINGIKIFSICAGEGFLSKYIYIYKGVKRLISLPQQHTIIASQYGSNSIIGIIYSILNKTKVIVRGSGREIEIINDNKIKRIIFKFMSKKIHNIVAINNRLEKSLVDILGVRGRPKIKYITNSVNIGDRVDIEKNKNILCVSRIEYIKGIDTLLEVWKLLEKRGCSIPLTILGDGSEKKKLREKYNFLNTVSWENETSNVDEYIEKARVVISTSRYEGVSNSILEAMARGVPVIATRNYGNSELIKNNITGLLTSFEIEDICDEVVKLYNDYDRLTYIANNAREYVRKERDVKGMIKKYVNIIER